MPRRKNAKPGPVNRDVAALVPFHNVLFVTASTSLFAAAVTPSTTMSSRAAQIAESYQLYRMKALKFRLRTPSVISGVGYTAAAYVTGGISVSPATINDVIECPYSTLLTTIAATTFVTHTEWVVVPPAALRGPLPWYKTIVSASVDSWEELSGSLHVWSSQASGNIVLEVVGEFEFKGPIDPDMSLSRPEQIARVQKRLAKLLAGADPDVGDDTASQGRPTGRDVNRR